MQRLVSFWKAAHEKQIYLEKELGVLIPLGSNKAKGAALRC